RRGRCRALRPTSHHWAQETVIKNVAEKRVRLCAGGLSPSVRVMADEGPSPQQEVCSSPGKSSCWFPHVICRSPPSSTWALTILEMSDTSNQTLEPTATAV